jgi:hypothetical protein
VNKAKRVLIALLALGVPMAAARADDNDSTLDRAGFEVGGRFWYSSARNGYNYYGDATTSMLVSRLTYDGLPASSGELYFRGDVTWGLFIKGFIGAGVISGGHLIDEDFPPLTVPYSQTSSNTSGSLNYGTIDLGYSFIRQPKVRLGAFVGYGRWHESVNGNGCTQLASNTDICTPAVPTFNTLVNETDDWNLLRIGVAADVMLSERIKLTADAAYVHAWQKAVDNHFWTWGLDPASGSGNGFQLDAIVSYQLTNALNLGVGGRWWHLDTSAMDSFDQLLTYRTDRYGVFVQGSYKLN